MSRVGRVGKIHDRLPRCGGRQQGSQRVGHKGRLRGRIGLAGHTRRQFIREAVAVQQVCQPRDGIRNTGSGDQPVNELATIRVQGTPDFGPQLRQVDAAQAARVARRFFGQQGVQALLLAGLGVAMHGGLVQAQVLGNGGG